MYAVAIISLCAIAISKADMLFFHLRITPRRSQRIACYILAGICGLWMLVVMVVIGTRCGNKTPWVLYGRTCHTFVGATTHIRRPHNANIRSLKVGTVDWHCHHRLNPRAIYLRGPRLDTVSHPHTTQLQEHDLDRIRLATLTPDLCRHPCLYRSKVDHDNTNIWSR